MTTLYSQLIQDMWFKDRNLSRTESLMKAYEPPRQQRGLRADTTIREKVISRITFEEEQHEREMASIRNFGHHWLKPIGVSKTMAQAEDEAREIHESYEEYEGEDGDFNQNDPDLLVAGTEGPIASPREEATQSEAEEQDLDQDIEEGASFDAGETSYASSAAPITPVPIAASLYTTINGQPYIQRADGSLMPAQPPRRPVFNNEIIPNAEEEEGGLSSADEGSIGNYSSESQDTEPDQG